MANVSIIGSGNLAWHLAPALDNAGYAVREVYSRNPKHAEALVERLYQATIKRTLDFSDSASRIFIVAVTDDAVPEVAQNLMLPEGALLLHTSGSQPLSILDSAPADATGVLYPLQTFTKSKRVDLNAVPIFVETGDPLAEKTVVALARAISGSVNTISSTQREALHVAAVFASNFTNHMMTLARHVAVRNRLDFQWLKPLLAETFNKSLTLGPEAAQTGPAKRGDLEILDRHLEFLRQDEGLAEIYRVVSQDILDRYQEED